MERHAFAYKGAEVLSPKHIRYPGFALVWAAIVITALFLLVGLSIDWAKLLYNLHELQNAADAAAMAGAQIVKVKTADETRLWTQEIASENTAEKLHVYLRTDTVQNEPFVDNPNLDIILGRWINNQRYFFPTLDTPDAVKVIARRADGLADAPPLSFLFGPFVGVNTTNARCEAIGWYYEIGGPGLIILDRWPKDIHGNPRPGLQVGGAGDVRVIGGGIHVNSEYEGDKSEAAVYIEGNGQMLCGRLSLTGTTDPYSYNTELWADIWMDEELGIEKPYDIFEGAPYMSDPLGYIPPPPIPTDGLGHYIVAYNEKITTSCTLDPGYYPRGIEVSDAGTTVILNPGTYWIGGGNPPGNQVGGLIFTGGTLIGHGVLIYLTKDYVNPGGKWAQLRIGGNVTMDITPPGDEVSPKIINGLEGVSIWQDRNNTENETSLHGGAGMMISGTLYFPNNHLYLSGVPGKAGNQIICGSLELSGTAEILVSYDGRNDDPKGIAVLVQ
jgi:hypothetical protein